MLQGLSLNVPPGEITFIIGRSGEGKSVTLKHIVGILRPDEGQVLLNGRDMTLASEDDWIKERKKMGLLFQDGALFDSLSVSENIAFAMNEDCRQAVVAAVPAPGILLVVVLGDGGQQAHPAVGGQGGRRPGVGQLGGQ